MPSATVTTQTNAPVINTPTLVDTHEAIMRRARYYKNKEIFKNCQRRYYAKNRTKILAQKKEYYLRVLKKPTGEAAAQQSLTL